MTFAPKGGYPRAQNTDPAKLQVNRSSYLPADPKTLPTMSRPVNRTSFYYFKLYQRIWSWSFVTIAFDLCTVLFLPIVQAPVLSQELCSIFEIVCIALMAVSSSWFFKNWLLSILSSWNNTRERLFKTIEKHPLLIFALLGIVVAFEVFLKVGQVGILSSVLTVIIIIGALKPFREGIRERIQKDKNIAEDLSAQVEAYNQRMFLVHLVPLAAARLTILLSALAFSLSVQLEPNYLVSLSFGCIMLSLMRAEEPYFMIICPRCGTKTSRFLAPYKACLACLATK